MMIHFFRGYDLQDRAYVMRLTIVILPWPKYAQENGALIRSFALIEIEVGQKGFRWFRYSPNRAEYHLKGYRL